MRFRSISAVLGILLCWAAPAAWGQSAKPAGRDALGCFDLELSKRTSTIANSGDQEAFNKLAGPAVKAGKCQVVAKGTMLFKEDTALMSGLACFRPIGDARCLWMASDLT